MREEYIDTGQVRFIFRHAAFLGPESTKAAEGSECAADQNHFWAYHDALFADQTQNRSRVTDEYLVDMAEAIGLDTPLFQECLATASYDNEVIELAMRIKSRGARGVPGFMINGQYVTGAIPYENFQQYIDQELTKAAR